MNERRHATRAEQDRETLPQLLDELEADHGPEIAAIVLRLVTGELPDRYRRPGAADVRMPHRDDPRAPWSDDEVRRLYQSTPAEPPWPDVYEDDDDPAVLLGPDGNPLPPSHRPPFGFQPSDEP